MTVRQLVCVDVTGAGGKGVRLAEHVAALTQDNDSGAVSDDSAGDGGGSGEVQGRDRAFFWKMVVVVYHSEELGHD